MKKYTSISFTIHPNNNEMSKYLINYIEEGKTRREYQQRRASVGISLLNSETEPARGKGGGLCPVTCFSKYL